MQGQDAHDAVTLLLTGDVMVGRGIDQILPHPSDPVLFESFASSALDYVRLAASRSGPVPRPVTFDYVWGDALEAIDERQPDLRIVNLETAVTTSDTPVDKGINYRMHPRNIGVLKAAGIDACVLANNHVGDWGAAGLIETINVLHAAGMATAGAGLNLAEAEAPAILPLRGSGRLLLAAFGTTCSGIPRSWEARADRAGVHLAPAQPDAFIDAARRLIMPLRAPNDIAVASVHWGGNWGYEVTEAQQATARGLVELAGIDVVHSHSSHHPRPIEVHQGKLILYGCGDFLNDYEGISGKEQYRADLVLAYFVQIERNSGRVIDLEMVPFRTRRLRLERATREDARWLAETLSRESARCSVGIELQGGSLRLVSSSRAEPGVSERGA